MVREQDIAFTQYDMTCDFQLVTSEGVGATGEPQLLTQRVARIVMSPTHAKVLAETIRSAVSQWEGRFGALPAAEALLAPGPAAAPTNEAGDRDD